MPNSPSIGATTEFYTSDPDAESSRHWMARLAVRHIEPKTGEASGIEVCYEPRQRGLALHYLLTMAAARLNLLGDLLSECEFSQSEPHQRPALARIDHRCSCVR